MGGLKRVLTNKINYLVENYGYDVTIVTRRLGDRPPYYPLSPKVQIIDLKLESRHTNGLISKLKSYLSIIFQYYTALKKILYEVKPDVTISVFSFELYFLFLLNDGSKKIVECHGPRYFWSSYPAKGITKITRRIRNRIHSLLLKKYDAFVVLTHEDRAAWKELRNVYVIPNPINTSDQKASLNNNTVVSVGRLVEGKRFDHLIRAWSIVHQNHPEWRLNIVGDGNLRPELNSLIKTLNLEQTVFLKGESKNIIKEYLSASVFVLASEHEGLPMVLLEAMSFGLPLISYSCPCGPKDLIQNGVNGFLVEPLDYYGLAEKITSLLSNPEMINNMGQNNYEKSSMFGEEKIMRSWNDLFSSLLEKNIF